MAASVRRLSSSAASTLVSKHRSQLPSREKRDQVVYTGSMAPALRGFKMVTLGIMAVSSFSTPMISVYAYPHLPLAAKSMAATGLVALSMATAAALHWFSGPYVTRLQWQRGSQHFDVEKLSLWAMPVKSSVQLSQVRRPDKKLPLVTFAAQGEYYYVDEDGFPDDELLKKLVKGKRRTRDDDVAFF